MLRVCTWNIQFGRRLDEILDAVSGEDGFEGLDLLALQESSEHEGRPDAEALAQVLGNDYACYQVAAQTVKGRLQANALVWDQRRIRVRQRDSIHLQPAAGAGPPPESRAVLRGLSPQQRNGVVIEGELGDLSLLAYSVHFDILGSRHKVRQMRRVLDDRRARRPADITVVAGDLNTFHVSQWPSWARLAAAYEAEGFEDTARLIRWTQSVRHLGLKQKLDAILVRSSVAFEHRSWTAHLRGSDHIPVFTNLVRVD